MFFIIKVEIWYFDIILLFATLEKVSTNSNIFHSFIKECNFAHLEKQNMIFIKHIFKFFCIWYSYRPTDNLQSPIMYIRTIEIGLLETRLHILKVLECCLFIMCKKIWLRDFDRATMHYYSSRGCKAGTCQSWRFKKI